MRLYEILEDISRRNFMKSAAAAATIGAASCPMCKGAHATRPLVDKTLKNPRLFNDQALLRRVALKVVDEYNALTNHRYKIQINMSDLPKVLPSYVATPDELERSLGIPLDTSRQSINHYDRFLNRILLAPDADIDSLAHELVHFIQFKFVPYADPYSDWVENQAIQIQHSFNWHLLY